MTPKRNVVMFSLLMGLLGCLLVEMPWTGALEENWGLHLLFQLRGERNVPRQVAIVAIDHESADRLKLPLDPVKWPRSVHAHLVQRLQALGAKVIVFDILFSDPQNGLNDQRFAQAMQAAGNVVLAQTLTRVEMEVTDSRGQPAGRVNLEKIIPPCARLSEAAAAQGPFPLPSVPMKLSRYWTFKPEVGEKATLPVAVFEVFARDSLPMLGELLSPISEANGIASKRSTVDHQSVRPPGPKALRSLLHGHPDLVAEVKRRIDSLPPDAADETRRRLLKAAVALYSGPDSPYFDFYGPSRAIPTVSYHRVLETSAPRELDFNGKAVFIGQTESAWPKVQDGFYHVFSRERGIDISGVEVAATAFANLLEARSVHPLEHWQHLILVFLWGVCAAFAGLLLPALFSWGGLVLMSGIYLVVAHHYFLTQALWIPIVVPVFFLLPLSLMAGLLMHYNRARRERSVIRQAFGFYLPDDVVDQLAENIQQVQNVGHVVYGICMMTDAARYTSVSETLSPDDLKRFMNDYYHTVFVPIKINDGIVLQVIGDSVLALWTASGPASDLRRKACSAALGVVAAVEDFNRDHARLALPSRIGINAGHIALGNIGAMDHYEYRPVGDMVNTASRLEGLNKYLGTRILMAEDMMPGLEGFFTRPMGRFLFAGKKKATGVFELRPMQQGQARLQELCATFSQGLIAFSRRDWDKAVQAFQTVLDFEREDGPARFYLEQCDRYKVMNLDKAWDGTVFLEHK